MNKLGLRVILSTRIPKDFMEGHEKFYVIEGGVQNGE